jgi:hypothetical protein
MTTLIFPASMPAANLYRQSAQAQGEEVVGASSLDFDESAVHYTRWLYLPYVDDPRFAEVFCEAVTKEGITRLYCPHVLVHRILRKLVEQHQLTLHFINTDPMQAENIRFRALFERTHQDMRTIEVVAGGQSRWNRWEVASVLHYSASIYGESGEPKILAMLGIVGELPQGDLVEIGVAWGRTAFVLGMIANRHAIGNVLLVDPWNPSKAVQKDTTAELQALATSWDWDLVAESALVNVMPVAMGRLNVLRRPSAEAATVYSNQRTITSDAFGSVSYTGKIALVHIDGNHDYSAVEEDYRRWRPHLAADGWVILDDYRWLHGDGPKRVGDAALEKEAGQIRRAFTAGNALFLQFGAA